MFVLGCGSHVVAAQTSVVEDEVRSDAAIESILSKPPGERVRALSWLVGHNLIPSERALEVALQVLDQDEVSSVPEFRVHAGMAATLAASAVGDNTQAMTLAHDTLSTALSLDDRKLEYSATAMAAHIDAEAGGAGAAVRKLLDFLRKIENEEEADLQAATLERLAILAWQSKCVVPSIDLYRRAQLIYLSKNDFAGAARMSRQIGIQCELVGDRAAAVRHAEQAVKFAVKSDKKSLVFSTRSYLIWVRSSDAEQQRGDAINELKEHIRNAADDVDSSDVGGAHLQLFRMLLAEKKFEAAEQQFQLAVGLVGNSAWIMRSARIDRALAVHERGKSAEALASLEQFLAKSPDRPTALRARALEVSADILQDIGDSQYGERLRETVDSLKAANIRNELASAEFLDVWNEYQQEQRAELAGLQRQKAVQSIQFYLAIGGGLACALLVFWLCRRSTRRRFDNMTRESLENLTRELDIHSQALREEMETRQKLELELEKNRKTEAIAALTSSVAHDFNNLMTVVISSNELIRLTSSTSLGERELQMLDESTHAAKSGAEITSQLLALARRRPEKRRLINLKDLIHEIRGLLQRSVGEGVTLDFVCLDEFACVYTDRTQLTSALINLCCNARDAVDGSGVVTLRIARPFGTDTTDPVVISVIDKGVGMSREQIEMACKPLYTTKPEGQGTGLGLSAVEQFVRSSGGALTIASRLGEGTTVSIKLPASKMPDETSDSDSGFGNLDGVSVVVVDDKTSVLNSVERTLKILGCNVKAAGSADEALAVIAENGPPDVLLSDVRMPGLLDGLGLAEWVRENHAQLPIVLMTGYYESPTSDFPVLPKPFTMQELSLALSVAIGPDPIA